MPTIPFPFEYVAKGGGEKISMSWKDVREGMNRDSMSTSMAFCTAHMTPSIVQSGVIRDAILREQGHQRSATPRTIRRNNNHQLDLRPESACAARSQLRSAIELDTLYSESQGGRKSYLKLRRRQHLQDRCATPLTTYQQIGWNYFLGPQEEFQPVQARRGRSYVDHRRQSFVKSVTRARGVFSHLKG